MDLAELITESRPYLKCFDYDHYPDNFKIFEERFCSIYSELAQQDPIETASGLIASLESGRALLPRRAGRTAAEEEKSVLALFLAPAAIRMGGSAPDFANALCSQWNEHYPKNIFRVGDYETIMKGFDSTLLGIPLRKSSKNRRSSPLI